MRRMDLCPPFKWFVEHVEITTSTIIDETYIFNIINKSKDNEEFWIPAIIYQHQYFNNPNVEIISDGIHEIFLGLIKAK